MKRWLHGRGVALIVFLAVAALVTGGLGWVTAEALRLEFEQSRDHAQSEFDLRLKRAMWQLDSRIWPVLAKEEGRPYNHYTALYAPSAAFRVLPKKGNKDAASLQPIDPGSVLEPSPLLTAELPPWMVLHFQTNMKDWQSPQLLSKDLDHELKLAWGNEAEDGPETPVRCEAMDKLKKSMTPVWLCKQVEDRAAPVTFADTVLVPNLNPSIASANPRQEYSQGQISLPQQAYANNNKDTDNNQPNYNPKAQGRLFQRNDFNSRLDQQARVQKEVQSKAEVEDMARVIRNTVGNGAPWLYEAPDKGMRAQKATIKLGPMVPLWPNTGDEQPKYLIVARMVNIAEQRLCQGVLLDWAKLQGELSEAVHDEFPEATFQPVRQVQEEKSSFTMAALPVEMNPGPIEMPVLPTWTPLRTGLLVAWSASLLGLAAAALGGWSLLVLSERRIRFVSAVTHELRTPLTTLRLYLDMLAGGLVAPAQQEEYVRTLHGETDRLNRLVSNVLDFSRLENQRPRLGRTTVSTADLLEQVRSDWQCRCQNAEKELVVENETDPGSTLTTDVQLVQQVLGNLVDNACKYSQGAEDRRIFLKAKNDARGRLVFAVEDRGPGVAPIERRSIFRAFRRGQSADATTGGVGLGLALARRWSRLLGGRLVLEPRAKGTGACFCLEMPKLLR